MGHRTSAGIPDRGSFVGDAGSCTGGNSGVCESAGAVLTAGGVVLYGNREHRAGVSVHGGGIRNRWEYFFR